ncbi:SRPBCC family protein [Zunongwangia sp.]|uniref:SRPBCC family protein n=1 Tax=Zunongwangia sp. TaxID=1965325 RepID=UPI003AA846AF
MKLESPKVSASKNQQKMFTFLTDVANYEQIMPSSKEKFEVVSSDKFLFQLKGMPEIALKIIDTKEPNLVVLGSGSDKFPFTLTIHIDKNGTDSNVQLFFNGEFNAMMAMMVKGPLQKFINHLSENISKL